MMRSAPRWAWVVTPALAQTQAVEHAARRSQKRNSGILADEWIG